jgi:DNA polymerase III epsilon subunit-like protein
VNAAEGEAATAVPQGGTSGPLSPAKPPLIFLDIETTGLDPFRHQVWEIAYATEGGPIESGIVRHSLFTADPQALTLNGHDERCECLGFQTYRKAFEMEIKRALVGAVIVGANPAFDTKFLRMRWESEPWHYRMIDIEAYAMPHLGLDRPKGLAGIAEALAIQPPDHSAAQDVYVLRECFQALQSIYTQYGET